MESITGNLSKNNGKIDSAIDNFSKISGKLANAKISESIESLRNSLTKLDGLLGKMTSKEGTLGLLLNQFSIFLVMLPFYMAAVGLFAVGLAWIVSSLHVFLRDTAQVLSVVLTFWFWMTPIFIDEDKFPSRVRFLLFANPLYYVVRAYRAVLLHSAMPSLADLAIAAAFGVGAFIAGGLFFRYMKRGFADVL